jgi:DNA-binding GntR family transcriptional regulator
MPRGSEAPAPRDAPARPSLTRTTLTEQTYEVLKERILDQDLAPGARLNIDALARDLGVSSSPLREALARLEAERLVVSALYSGYTVAPEPTSAYLLDLIDFRIMLEGRSALVGAPRKDPGILAEMRAMVRQMDGTRRLGTRYKQYRRFVAADIRFHQAIVRSGGNAVITQAYLGMNAILHQARLYLHRSSGEERAAEVRQEHARILQAFEKGDGEAANTALSHHLAGGKRRLIGAEAQGGNTGPNSG